MTDSCPNCCHRSVKPATTARRNNAIVHGYRCPACRHQWATARHLPSYSEVHQQRARRARKVAA